MPAGLLSESYDTDLEESWENERTATPVYQSGCSLRETQAILCSLGVERSHQAIWYWVHRLADSVPDPPTAKPSRVAVDENAVRINGSRSWICAAIDLDAKLILDVALFGRRGTGPAAAFLHRLTEKHDLSEAEFLVDGYGYLTSLSRLGLSGHLDYVDRNHTEKWFHILKIRVDRFHTSWVGSWASDRECLGQFVHYYNTQRPHQSLNKQPPAEMLN